MIGLVNENDDEVLPIVLCVCSDIRRVEQIVYQIQYVEVRMVDIIQLIHQIARYVVSEHQQEQYMRNVDDYFVGGGVVKIMEL